MDYAKAFDCVDHVVMWNALRKLGTPQHLILLLKSLYDTAEATIKIEEQQTRLGWKEL